MTEGSVLQSGHVTVPAYDRKPAAVWGVVLLGGWGLAFMPALLMALLRTLGIPPTTPIGVYLAFPVGLSGFALLGIYLLMWAIGGSESVEWTPDTLRIQRRILGVPISSREYDARHVTRLRVSPTPYIRKWNMWSSIISGAVAFDYGAKTFRFGVALPETEAQRLLESLGGAS